MVAYGERERVRGLLAEAITMLCKTSLSYKFGFTVEGLLGITLDNSQVFLINIHEEVKDKSWSKPTPPESLSSHDIPNWELCTSQPEMETFSCSTSVEHCPQLQSPVDLSKQNGRRSTGSTQTCPAQAPNPPTENKYSSTREARSSFESFHCQPAHRHKRQSAPPWTDQNQMQWKKKRPICEPPPLHAPLSHNRTPSYPTDRNDSQIFLRHNFQSDDMNNVILIKEEDEDSELSMDAFPEDEPEVESAMLNKAWTVSSKRVSVKKTNSTQVKREREDQAGGQQGGSPSPHSQVVYEAGIWSEAADLEHEEPNSGPTDTTTVSADLTTATETDDPNQSVPPGGAEWPPDVQRRPRASYSTAYKLMVVRRAMESGNMRATARKFGIHFKQVWQWTRNKDKLLAMSLSALRSPRMWTQSEDSPGESAPSESTNHSEPPGGTT